MDSQERKTKQDNISDEEKEILEFFWQSSGLSISDQWEDCITVTAWSIKK